jgi:hypothetical protein
MPVLHHPELDRTITVSTEKVAETYRRSGWVDPPDEQDDPYGPSAEGLSDAQPQKEK